MIDNFTEIADFIFDKKRLDKHDFFFLQIIKRRKDVPGLKRDMKLINNYFIKDSVDLLDRKQAIIDECEKNDARAYIHLNKRNYQKVAVETASIIVKSIASNNYETCRRAFTTACGKHHSDTENTWVVDVDKVEGVNLEDRIELFEQQINLLQPIGQKVLMVLPTVSGYHFITKPFRLDHFHKNNPDITVYKDNCTLIYYNKL